MTFDEVLEQALEMLRRRGRVSYRALKAQFQLDDTLLETLKDEIVAVHQLARDQEGTMLVWTGDTASPSIPASAPAPDHGRPPLAYTPPYLAEKILTSRPALAGERKQVTVLFADIKDSTEIIKDLDPEAAQQLLDPVLHTMMEAMHRFEGTVNQVLGDGIMALFGAPLAHEDHALRACYAALTMQTTMREHTEAVRRAQGIEMRIRVGLNSGEVVVRAIGPVVDLLKRYAHVEDADEPRTVRARVTGQVLTLDETLQETVPALLWLLDVLPDDSPFRTLEPPQRRQRTLAALKRVLLRESQVQPLLLVFEDLHWIDAETQALLDSLIDSLPTARLLLLVNYRPEYQHGWGSKTYYTQLRLDPLPPANAEVFLDALLGQDSSLAPLKRLLIERTEGNPFFLEESVRTLVETGVLGGEPGAYRLAQCLPTIQVPATVQAVLAARIDRLPPEEKQLLQAAAVIGTEVPMPLLQAIAELPEAVLHRGLAHLQATEFLYETRLFPEHAYTFKHALTQQVAYQSLLTSTRQRYHAQLAQALAARPETVETQPELLAHHYTEAGLTAPAVEYWQRAGERSNARSAYVEAVAHLTKGLEVLQTLPDTPERDQHELDIQLAMGQAWQVTKGYAASEVEHAYARARELCQQVGDTPRLAAVLGGLCMLYRTRGELQTARELGEQFLTLAQRLHDPERLAYAHWVLGNALFFLGEFVSACPHLEQALACSATPQDRSLPSLFDGAARVETLGTTAWGLWLLGYPDQALTRSHAMRTYAQELRHAFSLARALFNMATLHKLRGEAAATQEGAEAALAIMTEQGFGQHLASATITRGWALAAQGQYEEGMAEMRQGLAARRAMRTELSQAEFTARLAEAYGRVGQAEEGLRLLAETLAVVDKGNRWYEAELHRIKGELLLWQAVPDAPQAEACFQQALAVARCQQAKSWELRAALSLSRLWQQQGKRAEARELLAPIYSWFTEGFDTPDLQEARALLEDLGT